MSIEEDRQVEAERLLTRSVSGEFAQLRLLGDRAHHYLHAIVDNLGAGALLIEGRDRRIVLANRFMSQLIGLPHARILAMTREALVEHVASMAEDAPATRESLGRIPPGGAPYYARDRFVLRVPERRVIDWEAVPVLLPAGVGQLCFYRDVTAEVDAMEKLERLASTDPLTGLANRRRGLEVLSREIARSERHGNALCAAMFDLDYFKRINDTLGHAVGDEILCGVATILTRCSRKVDVAIRWGGEEMLVLLPDCSMEGAVTFANRFRTEVERWRGDLAMTVSGGIAKFRSGETAAQLLQRADDALYRAKQLGRNCVVETD